MPFSEEHFRHLVMEEECKVQFVALLLNVNVCKLYFFAWSVSYVIDHLKLETLWPDIWILVRVLFLV